MAINEEIKEQTDKFKDMTGKQKLDYIWTYYKWWIIGALAIIYIIVSVFKTVVRNSTPVYLSAVFLNSTLGDNASFCTLSDEFIEKYGVDSSAYDISMDYSIYLDDNYGNQASYAGQVKVISMYSAETIDILCGPEKILSGAADVGGYGNLSEILPEGMLDKIIAKGYEPYYYTEKIRDASADPDDEDAYTEGETYIGGIYIDNCKKLVGDDSSCVYSDLGDERWVVAIAWNTTNLDHAIEFLEFITE